MYSSKVDADWAGKTAEGAGSPAAGGVVDADGMDDEDLDDVDLDDSVDMGSGAGGGAATGLGLGMAGLSLGGNSGGNQGGAEGRASGSSPVAINLVGMSKTSDLEISPFPTLAAQEEEAAMGENVDVVFHIGSTQTIEARFGSGQTVHMMRAWLEKEHDVQYDSQKLLSRTSGAVLLDPLSLNDLPDLSIGEEFHVDVQTAQSQDIASDGGGASKNERK